MAIDRFYRCGLAFWGVVKSSVSPFVSKRSISPSAISLAAIALIVASSRAFLQISLPSRSVINSTKSPEIRFSAALIFHSISEFYGKLRMNLPCKTVSCCPNIRCSDIPVMILLVLRPITINIFPYQSKYSYEPLVF